MNKRKRRNPIRRFFTFGLLIVAAAFITIPELIGLTYRAVKSDKEVVVKHEVIKTEDI